MDKRIGSLVVALLAVAAMSIPMAAHHSFSMEYDLTKPMHIEGKVSRVEWGNPHVFIFVAGKDITGTAAEWHVEASQPDYLQLLGWYKNTVMPGMDVRVGGYPAKQAGNKNFGGTVLTILSSQTVFKIPTCWGIPGVDTAKLLNDRACTILEVP